MTMRDRYCLECRFCRLEPGSPDYSELTPGYDMGFRCEKKHWEFDTRGDGKAEMRDMLDTARTCADFDQDPDVKPRTTEGTR